MIVRRFRPSAERLVVYRATCLNCALWWLGPDQAEIEDYGVSHAVAMTHDVDVTRVETRPE